MSINEKLTAIADSIRRYTIGQEKLSLDDMASQIDRVNTIGFENGVWKGIEDGRQAQYDEFWDAYQNNGTKTNYQYAFCGGSWDARTFKPKYLIKPTDAMYMFLDCGRYNESRENIDLREFDIDFSKCENMAGAFMNAIGIGAIGEVKVLANWVQNNTFSGASNLHTIELYYLTNGTQNFNNTFAGCTSLANITIGGVIAGTISFAPCPFTKESITSIVEHLSASMTGKTLTLKKSAVDSAFETAQGAQDGSGSQKWATLIATKSNWTISLV